MSTESSGISAGKMIFTLVYILVFPAGLLLLSGDWLWTEGWIFGIWFTVLCFTTIIYLYLRDPALLSERYRKPGTANQKEWDRFVVYGLMAGFVSWIVVMPLDAKRFAWSPVFPAWIKCIGGIFLVFSFFLFYRSYTDNTYLSALVRIQSERRHKVVSTGVYGFVRHPMYLAATLLFTGTPLLLGSAYGLLIGLAMVFLLAGRIRGEEKMLVNELEGYEEYKLKVRYRLLPFVW